VPVSLGHADRVRLPHRVGYRDRIAEPDPDAEPVTEFVVRRVADRFVQRFVVRELVPDR
jgi:hypothetical protein